jgi:large subunit ribosomal protein L1
MDIKTTIEESKAGRIEFRVDKTGIVHTSIGRASFGLEELQENIQHLMAVLIKAKPQTVKGQYVKSIAVSATQTPSVRLDLANFQ